MSSPRICGDDQVGLVRDLPKEPAEVGTANQAPWRITQWIGQSAGENINARGLRWSADDHDLMAAIMQPLAKI